jgi:MtN3 and saliva related transmembrane protein
MFVLPRPGQCLSGNSVSQYPFNRIKFLHMRIDTLLGFMAGTLTTLSFVPQVHKAWRTRRCTDLSWGMLLAFAAGVTLWLCYGLLLRQSPIIVANAVTLALLVALIVMKANYRA